MADINQTPPITALASTHSREPNRDGKKQGGDSHEGAEDSRSGDTDRDTDVEITLAGIPEEEATPNVRAAMAKIMVEFDHQRAELERVQLRATYLEEQQDLDPVLPVAGRLALLRRLSRAVHRSEQSAMSNALIAFHIAGVHEVRLSKGRPLAERLMMEVSKRVQATLRQTDFLASLGGYDLGVLLPLADASDAEEKARAISAGIQNQPFSIDATTWSLTVAWGVVTFSDHGDPQQILDQADADLMIRR